MEQSLDPTTNLAQLVRTNECDWKPLDEPGIAGIFVKVFRFDTPSQRAPTILLRFEPGALYPAHDHPGGGEVFVLEGEVNFGKRRLAAGDYLYTPPNRKHAVWSESGCVLLPSAPEEVVIVKKTSVSSRAPDQG